MNIYEKKLITCIFVFLFTSHQQCYTRYSRANNHVTCKTHVELVAGQRIDIKTRNFRRRTNQNTRPLPKSYLMHIFRARIVISLIMY